MSLKEDETVNGRNAIADATNSESVTWDEKLEQNVAKELEVGN